MKVFISWSGPRAKIVAETLRKWIPNLMEAVKPWVSSRDIEAGTRSLQQLDRELEGTDFGIICLTQENQEAPWIMFEAGALSKKVESARVCPYLIAFDPSELLRGPISQFQYKRSNKEGTWELISAINSNRKDNGRSPEELREVFEVWWPKLEEKLRELPAPTVPIKRRRTDDVLSEVLEIVRGIERNSPDPIRSEGFYMKSLLEATLPPVGLRGAIQQGIRTIIVRSGRALTVDNLLQFLRTYIDSAGTKSAKLAQQYLDRLSEAVAIGIIENTTPIYVDERSDSHMDFVLPLLSSKVFSMTDDEEKTEPKG